MNVFEALTANDAFQEATKPVHAEAPNCPSCESHHQGWCKAVQGKNFYNIKYLAACPLRGFR